MSLNRAAVGLLLAVLGASAVLAVGMIGYFQAVEPYADGNVVVFANNDMAVVSGRGTAADDAIRIERPGADGSALLSSAAVRLESGQLNEVRWHIEGLRPEHRLQLVWTTRLQPNSLKSVQLPVGDAKGRLALNSVAGWDGLIGALGVRIEGPLSDDDPVTFHRLQLQPTSPGARQLLTQLWRQWTATTEWSLASVNFITGRPSDTLLTLLPLVAAWLLIACLLYAGWHCWRRPGRLLTPLAVLLVVAWLLVDARWQWQLGQRAWQTWARFGGLSWTEKKRADVDGELFAFVEDVKKLLPADGARIFIVDGSVPQEQSLFGTRARYHLLPYNAYHDFSEPPSPEFVHEGDYLIILRPTTGIGYSQRDGQLMWGQDGDSLSVEMLSATEVGFLFRVVN